MSALEQTEGLTCIGLGQIGQAYLALLYFLCKGALGGRRIALIDDDRFQRENGRTQLLLEEGGEWLGEDKVTYIERILDEWDAEIVPVRKKIGVELAARVGSPGCCIARVARPGRASHCERRRI